MSALRLSIASSAMFLWVGACKHPALDSTTATTSTSSGTNVTTPTTSTTTSGGVCEALEVDLASCPGSPVSACECLGCDEGCDSSDCVCPSCAGSRSDCADCDDNGVCEPYKEACTCADCAAHPSCASSSDDTSTTSTDGGESTATDTGGSTTGASSSTGSDHCGAPDWGDEACQDCIDANCCAEAEACVMDVACQDAYACLLTCNAQSPDCYACYETSPPENSASYPMSLCISDACTGDNGSCPPPFTPFGL